MLERYGRFEDCTLSFRQGAPDLHVIYGPNEAGKSTTLAAVSDLLFGFGGRTGYDFRFAPALLRVGAELEEDGTALVCRRRKGNKATLLDEADQPMEEGRLLAMLRGQTRDGFRLAFSLDQERLRLGGRAMVEAKDDVGQALFAAGSGLTAVAAELGRLDGELDAIWGPRASAKRSLTIAEREFGDACRLVRDASMRPKAWNDARLEVERSLNDQQVLERRRDQLLAEQRRIDRIRRVAPGLRRREELLLSLVALDGTPLLSPQRETLAEAAMSALATAGRDRTAAASLHAEAIERLEVLALDAGPLILAERIEELIERRGAITKAEQDRSRLVAELRAKEAHVEELGRELGSKTAVPTRLQVAELREVARRHVEAESTSRIITGTLADLTAREQPVQERLADAALSEHLPALVAAVDAANRLGDVDARCLASADRVERASTAFADALRRLAPWTGDLAALRAVGSVGEGELTSAHQERTTLGARVEEEDAAERRFQEEAATLTLERDSLEREGSGITLDAVAAARRNREGTWRPIALHLSGGMPLPDPTHASGAMEDAISAADAVSDMRFASAQASSRLADLHARIEAAALKGQQARSRRGVLAVRLEDADAEWRRRLANAGLPAVSPDALRTWLADRQAALDAALFEASEKAALRLEEASRAAVRSVLVAIVPPDAVEDGTLLAPILARAELVRREGEGRDESFRQDRTELREIERTLVEQRRRLAQAGEDIVRYLEKWNGLLAASGLELAISSAETRLSVFDELRADTDAAAQLELRVHGIDADQQRFEQHVAALAKELGETSGSDAGLSLTAVRQRLNAARDVDRQRIDLTAEVERRRAQVGVAAAASDAARASLAPALAEAGLHADDDIAPAIEASRNLRRLRGELADVERQVTGAADGMALLEIEADWRSADPDQMTASATSLAEELAALNSSVSVAAAASGQAARSFEALDNGSGAAADAASDVEQARAEMAVQSETYLLKRTQVLMLRWAMERYRAKRQDPLLTRASELFAILTAGTYLQLRVDMEGSSPRLGGLRDDGRTIVEIGGMSEGTTDQLFLALRLAAVEQSVASGVRLPFLADDLFVNFDDERAEAGFRVLADLARSTQVLFFTHHPHLASIAKRVIGAELHSECTYP